jgi:hypothetical protein
VIDMSDKDVEIETEKGNIRIPWKVVMILLGITAAAVGLTEDAFQTILETAGV